MLEFMKSNEQNSLGNDGYNFGICQLTIPRYHVALQVSLVEHVDKFSMESQNLNHNTFFFANFSLTAFGSTILLSHFPEHFHL